MFKKNGVFEKANEVDEILRENGCRGYVIGMIIGDKDNVIDIHMFNDSVEYQMQYVYKEGIEAEAYYSTFMMDFANKNLKEIKLNSDEKYLLDILEDNRIGLCIFSDHVLSFEFSDEEAVDMDDITSLKYDKVNNLIRVHEKLDNVDIIIDLNKEELRYIVNNTDKELSFDEYLDYLDSERLDEEIKRAKKCIENNEEYMEEYETTDLVEFLNWMEEFNEQENNEYELIIQNKNITQIYRNEDYEFCAIEDIVKYYKTVLRDGSIELAIEFKYIYPKDDEHIEVWNISKDFGFEM